MTAPDISVIMPVFNAQRYVADAVESILQQDSVDFEFLIVDDGSTDSTFEILKRYALADKRIRLWSRENTGYVFALNELLSVARGQFIARMDADDVAAKERLWQQRIFLESHTDCICVGSRVNVIGPEGEPIGPRVEQFDHADIDEALLAANAFAMVHPSCMYRATAIRYVGGYDTTLAIAEDIDLFLKLAEIGRLANLRSCLLNYRMHAASVTHSKLVESHETTSRVINLARATTFAARDLSDLVGDCIAASGTLGLVGAGSRKHVVS